MDGLHPPDGFRVDATVATTYSLDLTVLLLPPLSFALHDREVRDPERVDPNRPARRGSPARCPHGGVLPSRGDHQMRTWQSVLTFAEELCRPDPGAHDEPRLSPEDLVHPLRRRPGPDHYTASTA